MEIKPYDTLTKLSLSIFLQCLFKSCLLPLLQDEPRCETIRIKSYSICGLKINWWVKLISYERFCARNRFETEIKGTRKWPINSFVLLSSLHYFLHTVM